MLGWIDPIYLVFAIPGLLLGLVAQAMVKSAYEKASKIRSRSGLTGEQIARAILEHNHISDVKVEPTEGFLTDHYHPLQKTLRLSKQNFHGDSLAALGIAAHEVGHAVQHARGYVPLYVRSAVVPAAMVGSNLSYILFAAGLFFAAQNNHSPIGRFMIYGGIALFSAAVFFTLITLPVEFNASKRAVAILMESGVVSREEIVPIKSVLRAAALTYVAAAVTSILTLLYMIMRARSMERN